MDQDLTRQQASVGTNLVRTIYSHLNRSGYSLQGFIFGRGVILMPKLLEISIGCLRRYRNAPKRGPSTYQLAVCER